MKRRRLELGMSLRNFCDKSGIDPGNQSRMERGLLPPPCTPEKLEALASQLQIRQNSPMWREFSDLAAASAGRIPKDLLEDKEVLSELPVLFRTLRGAPVSEEQLERLVELIRRTR